MKSYEKPQIEALGTLHELTQTAPDPGNKVGPNKDMFSRIVPLVGSVGPVRP